MRWMEYAWADVGIKEIEGPDAEPQILAYFHEVGRTDVTSDEVAWCAAYTLACLSRAGVSIEAVPLAERLMARSVLKIGTPIDGPRVGATVTLKRGPPPFGHTGFVTGWTETHVHVLSGNQGNSVSEQWFPREDVLGYRWPAPAAKPEELAKQGSRTVQTARQVQHDGWRSVIAELFGQGTRHAGEATTAGDAARVVQETHGLAAAATDFLVFAWGALPLMFTAASIYFALRMVYHAGWISWFRAEDHNTGKSVAGGTDVG